MLPPHAHILPPSGKLHLEPKLLCHLEFASQGKQRHNLAIKLHQRMDVLLKQKGGKDASYYCLCSMHNALVLKFEWNLSSYNKLIVVHITGVAN